MRILRLYNKKLLFLFFTCIKLDLLNFTTSNFIINFIKTNNIQRNVLEPESYFVEIFIIKMSKYCYLFNTFNKLFMKINKANKYLYIRYQLKF